MRFKVCPYCLNYTARTVSTRLTTEGKRVRRKNCLTCNARWYTIQEPEKVIAADKIKYMTRYRGKNPKLKRVVEKIIILK